MDSSRPSVSRETRLLLAVVLVSLSMLWVLASIRFPGRPATPNPVQPVLAQLAPPSAFDDIAATVAQLGPRIRDLLEPVNVQHSDASNSYSSATAVVPALRVRPGFAVAMVGEHDLPRSTAGTAIDVVAHDRMSGLALLRVPSHETAGVDTWSPGESQYPRFLIASDASVEGISLRPVFVGAFHSIVSPFWTRPLWVVPDGVALRPATFVFTVDGELAGLAVNREERMAVVPGDLVMDAVDRLSSQQGRTPGWLGVDVQTLSPALAPALHATTGVVVTWVDPRGAAADLLSTMDVVEKVNGNAVASTEQWEAQVLALWEGDAALLDVRHGGEPGQVRLTARAQTAGGDGSALGVSLRTVPRIGVEVLRVTPGSAGARAGLQPGDIMTHAADIDAPSQGEIARLFAAESPGGSLLVALTRDRRHLVVAIEKTP